MSRWDSAAMVPNTSELLPEPETPVNTVSRRFGISMLTSLRLFTRAPCTRIRPWRSASCSAVGSVSVLVAMAGSARLLDPDEVAGRVAEGAVAQPVGLIGGLLDDLGAARLDPGERLVEVRGREVDAGEGALGHHL